MKSEDRKRQNIATAELTQALGLLKLASRSLVNLHERLPRHRGTLKTYTEAYHRWFSEEWDTLIGIMDLEDRREYIIPADAKPTAQEVVNLFMHLIEQHDVAVTLVQRVVHVHPEMLPWAADLVKGLWSSVNTVQQSFGRTQITIRHQERLAKLGKPDPVGAEAGEPVRPIEPPLRVDAEYAAWETANPADAILPPSASEDFIVQHGDGSVTRLRELAPAYEAGLIDRPWSGQHWEVELLHDLILVRSCAVNIRRVSESHLNWWIKPLKDMVRHLDPDALLETAKALIADMMSAEPMLMTSLGNGRGGGYIPTHAGRSIVEGKLLPQWPSTTAKKEARE